MDTTKVELAGADELALEEAVGWGSFEGTPADEGRADLASDAVGNTISSLLGRPAEGCLEGRSLELGAVGCTSLLGTGPTDGTYVELVVTSELGGVGCTSLVGAGPTDGLDST